MKTLIENNEVRLYPNSKLHDRRFNVHIRNEWFSQEFVYKVYDDRVVFKRPTLEYKRTPTRARKIASSWVFFLTLNNAPNSKSFNIDEEDINEDRAILYL